FRSAASLAVLLPWVLYRRANLRTRRLTGQIMRGLFGLASMYCFFYALGHMPLGEAVLLNYSMPLFIPFVAYFWLREPMSRMLFAVIALGFVGVALILKPGLELFTPAALVGLASGVLAAVSMVGIRDLTSSEPPFRIVFYYSLTCTLGSAIPLLWAWHTPAAHMWIPILVIGVCASIGHMMMTRAYGLAPASQVGPFCYATVIFAGLIGWMFWDEIPDVMSIVGTVMVCAAGILTIRFSSSDAVPAAELPPPIKLIK
ncbi:MAG TPA: DMT family transporter, partial [Burkholderiales bacterium]|nr:DMT family transporter [Burkholderiales bacterium]